MKFGDMTTKKLKEWAASLHDVIYNADCYGARDLRNYEGVLHELDKRGIIVNEHATLVFEETEPEES